MTLSRNSDLKKVDRETKYSIPSSTAAQTLSIEDALKIVRTIYEELSVDKDKPSVCLNIALGEIKFSDLNDLQKYKESTEVLQKIIELISGKFISNNKDYQKIIKATSSLDNAVASIEKTLKKFSQFENFLRNIPYHRLRERFLDLALKGKKDMAFYFEAFYPDDYSKYKATEISKQEEEARQIKKQAEEAELKKTSAQSNISSSTSSLSNDNSFFNLSQPVISAGTTAVTEGKKADENDKFETTLVETLALSKQEQTSEELEAQEEDPELLAKALAMSQQGQVSDAQEADPEAEAGAEAGAEAAKTLVMPQQEQASDKQKGNPEKEAKSASWLKIFGTKMSPGSSTTTTTQPQEYDTQAPQKISP